MLIIIIAVFLILSFFPLWAIVRLPDWEKKEEDREQEEYLKMWMEERRRYSSPPRTQPAMAVTPEPTYRH